MFDSGVVTAYPFIFGYDSAISDADRAALNAVRDMRVSVVLPACDPAAASNASGPDLTCRLLSLSATVASVSVSAAAYGVTDMIMSIPVFTGEAAVGSAQSYVLYRDFTEPVPVDVSASSSPVLVHPACIRLSQRAPSLRIVTRRCIYTGDSTVAFDTGGSDMSGTLRMADGFNVIARASSSGIRLTGNCGVGRGRHTGRPYNYSYSVTAPIEEPADSGLLSINGLSGSVAFGTGPSVALTVTGDGTQSVTLDISTAEEDQQ